MAATNLDTTSKKSVYTVRKLEDASDIVAAELLAADPTDGATFTNTGREVVLFHTAGGGTEDEVYHILRQAGVEAAGRVSGVDAGDDSGHAYDVVTVPSSGSDATVLAVGPFDVHRYGATVTLSPVTSVDLALLSVLKLS